MPTADQDDVDIRFLLANERTFLAWVRTAVTLLAAGVGVLQFLDASWRAVPGLLLLVAGGASAAAGVWRYRRADEAIRSGEVPRRSLTPLLVGGTVVVLAAIILVASVAAVLT